ncbi:PaaI family thioesterase, partial [Nevskia sp.]|uniref:PaaI family thioesterase n=1 Tax=Nevskia sp. TaxID=1929292 RepID=UPI0025E38B71
MSRPLQPVLDAAEVERIISDGLPMSSFAQMVVTEVKPGSATIRIPFREWMIRPGGTIAGPVLMLAADSAMYAVILAHIGDQVMAVTSSLTINFLSRPRPVDVV